MKERLWPRVIEGKQPSVEPEDRFRHVATQETLVRREARQRLEGDVAQADHPRRVKNLNKIPQVLTAVGDLGAGRPIVPASLVARVAQHRVRDKDLASAQARRAEQLLERPAGSVTGKRCSRRISPKPTRSFRDEHNACRH